MFPHKLDEDGYPKDDALKGLKTTLQCYDHSKLVNHGTITLWLKHYAKDSFQDHQFFVVETPTRKEIIIGHPVSVRLGLIQVLWKNHVKTVSSIEMEKTNNLSRICNIDGKVWPSKQSSSESKNGKSSNGESFQDPKRGESFQDPKHQKEHPYGKSNRIQSNSSSFQDQNPQWVEEKWQYQLISGPLIQSMTKRVQELNSKYYLLTNEQTKIVSEPARALRDRLLDESTAPLKHPGSTRYTWSQVAFKLIVPGTCRPCFPTLLIE